MSAQLVTVDLGWSIFISIKVAANRKRYAYQAILHCLSDIYDIGIMRLS